MRKDYKLEKWKFYEVQKSVRADLPYWYILKGQGEVSEWSPVIYISFDYWRENGKDWTWNKDWTYEWTKSICPMNESEFPKWIIDKIKMFK